jgi:hypothetical protein
LARGAILAGALFVSFAYFYEGGGWNQNSRFDLVRAITDRGTLQIDPYGLNTGDKAVHNGHVYSDKAPGLAFLSVPFVAAARPMARLAGVEPESYPGIALLSYLATVMTSALSTALAAWCLFVIARKWGVSDEGAAFAAIGFALATPVWTSATLFIGHGLSAACLVFAFTAAIYLRDSTTVARDRWLGLAVGLGGGWATVTEFPAAVPAGLIAILAVIESGHAGRRRVAGMVMALSLGALGCAAVLMVYHGVAFGSAFHVGYLDEEQFAGMKQGLFGLTYPHADRVYAILFGEYRGLLPLAPVLAVAPLGLAMLARDRRRRAAALTAALITAFYVVLNASYVYWEGGWSYGPRHVIPGVPFLALGLAPLWTRATQWLRVILAGLAVYGVALSLMAVAVMAQPPADFKRPVRQLLWPAFRAGDLALNQQDFTLGGQNISELRSEHAVRAAWNLGQRLGLRGHASLAPLAAIWLMAGWGWWLLRGEPHRRLPRDM